MSGMFDKPDQPAKQQEPPQRSGRSRALIITAGVLVALFIALTGFSTFWTERMWFDSVGYSGVFSTLLWTRVGLFLVFGGLMAAVVALNIAAGLPLPAVLPQRRRGGPQPRALPRRDHARSWAGCSPASRC